MPDLPERPKAAAFDALETIFALEPLRERLMDVGLPPESLELWFARTLRDGFAQAASGSVMEFPQVAASALDTLLFERGIEPTEDQADAVVTALRELEPHPDVEPAMRALLESGVDVLVLTNGVEATTRDLLRHAGLEDLVSRVISAYEVGRWKPHPWPYEHAADAAGVEPGEMVMVTVHGWDVEGAKRAGLMAAWAGRAEGRFTDVFEAPDVEGDDLVGVVDGVLSLPVAAEREA